jgi:hypothetical protein
LLHAPQLFGSVLKLVHSVLQMFGVGPVAVQERPHAPLVHVA